MKLDSTTSQKRLILTIVINLVITTSQIVGGFISGSLALFSDALHNFSDVLALAITYIANILVQKKFSTKRTYGYKRAEIMAALFNSAILLGIGFLLIKESVFKFFKPSYVDSLVVIWLAILSIVLNLLCVLILHKQAQKNINIKSSYIHLTTDVATSFAVLFGGLGIHYFELFWLDPLITIAIAIYLIFASLGILKKSISILMNFSPVEIDLNSLEDSVLAFEQIHNIHHIHIWKLNEKETYLEAHIEMEKDVSLGYATQILLEVQKMLKKKFNICHTTLQPEFGSIDKKELIAQEMD